MVTDLPDLLALLYGSGRRWHTLSAQGREWWDERGTMEAFARISPQGSITSTLGDPGPPEPDHQWRLWVRQPDRIRCEFEVAHGGHVTEIADEGRIWVQGPHGAGHVSERHRDDGLVHGPGSALVDTRGIPTAFDIEVSGPTEVLGRSCVVARARPVAGPRPGAAFHPLSGADEVQLAVDLERGVVLRLEALLGDAPFYWVEMTEVEFDEPLADELFALPPADERAAPLRPPPARHGGPPDEVLGEPVNVRLEVVHTDSVVVVVERIVAYAEGFELYVAVRTRDEQVKGTIEPGRPRSWSGTAAFPGESLRFGVQFSDGRRSLTGNFGASGGASGVTLMALSGSGTAARFDQRFWVQPLPPPGPVGLIVEWERRGIPETTVAVAAEEVLTAASRARPAWG